MDSVVELLELSSSSAVVVVVVVACFSAIIEGGRRAAEQSFAARRSIYTHELKTGKGKKENLVSLKDNNSTFFWVTLTGQKGKGREDNARSQAAQLSSMTELN